MFYPTQNRRGLIGHWKYHGNVSASGTWYDISGNGNNGTLVGNAFVDSNGVNLDGSGDYVTTATDISSYFGNGKKITMMAWVKPDVVSGVHTIITTYGAYPTGTINFRINAGKLNLYCNQDSPQFTYSGQTISAGVWTFVAIVWNQGSNVTAYVNNNNSGAISFSNYLSGSAQSIMIGEMWVSIFSDWYFPFDGIINRISVYSRALSANEILQIYHQTKGRYV